MTGDTIDAPNSQGLSNKPKNLKQQYGDKNQHKTNGGDVAGQNIDKSNTILNLFFGNADARNIPKEYLQDLDISKILDTIDRENIQKAYQDTLRRGDSPLWTSETNDFVEDFVEMLKNLDEFRRLTDFFECLSQDLNIASQVRKDLQKIIEKLTQEYQIKSTKKTVNDSSKNKLESYLLATLQPSDRNEYLMNAWLIIDDSVEGFAKFESLLNGHEQQQGVSCTLDSVSSQLNEFLKTSLELLRSRNRKNNEEHHLTIEFFLPGHLMCTEIDRWTITEDPIYNFKLGTEYPIRLRLLERLEGKILNSNYHLKWEKCWDKVQSVLHSEPIAELFEHLDCMDSFNWKELKYNLEEKIGLKLTCAPPKSKQEDLFRAILTAATPIAIWTRCDLIHSDRVAVINDLLSAGLLCNFCERVRRMRQCADFQEEEEEQEHLGLHLAVLWDNPYRLTPNAHKILREPGQ